ncbi:MAG TPA: exopolysaccharide biosynthesis protein [Cyclobacteriaceae bacterium]|nr:exopolysaccharide biosynthesis protein [Cyclobacteriaceae bacterium]
MSDQHQYIPEEKITLRQLLNRLSIWFNYCLTNFKLIVIISLLGGLLGYAYTFKRPTYFAETTFALEEASGFGLSQVAGLASAAGINIGALAGGSNGLFQGENIMQLYTSQRMIEETLLTEVEYEGKKEKLIYTYARERKLLKKWEKKPYLQNLSFDIPREQFTHHQDSILFKASEEIRDKFLAVSKPVRRLLLISVKVSFKDPVFTRHFNEALVKNVNTFYLETTTEKTGRNVNTLQAQADSIKNVLDQYVTEMALAMDATPNPNIINRSARVPAQKKQMDVQSTLLAYGEIMKSLEVAKLNHLNKTPLLKIVDAPTQYLDNNKWKWYKGIIIGLFLGGLIAVVYFTSRLIFQSALNAA